MVAIFERNLRPLCKPNTTGTNKKALIQNPNKISNPRAMPNKSSVTNGLDMLSAPILESFLLPMALDAEYVDNLDE